MPCTHEGEKVHGLCRNCFNHAEDAFDWAQNSFRKDAELATLRAKGEALDRLAQWTISGWRYLPGIETDGQIYVELSYYSDNGKRLFFRAVGPSLLEAINALPGDEEQN